MPYRKKSTFKALTKNGHSFEYAVNIHKSMYNSSKHGSTEYSPNFLHYGRSLSTLLDTFDPEVKPLLLNQAYEIEKILSTMRHVYNEVQENLTLKQYKQNFRHAQHHKYRIFNPKDIVYVKSRNAFSPTYSGPYQVVKNVSKVTVLIQNEQDQFSKPVLIHVDRLWKSIPRPAYLETN